MSKKELAKILACATIGSFAGEGVAIAIDDTIENTKAKEAIDWCAKNEDDIGIKISAKILNGGLKIGSYATGATVGVGNIVRELLK